MPVAQIICYTDENNIDLEKVEIDDLEKIYPKAPNYIPKIQILI